MNAVSAPWLRTMEILRIRLIIPIKTMYELLKETGIAIPTASPMSSWAKSGLPGVL